MWRGSIKQKWYKRTSVWWSNKNRNEWKVVIDTSPASGAGFYVNCIIMPRGANFRKAKIKHTYNVSINARQQRADWTIPILLFLFPDFFGPIVDLTTWLSYQWTDIGYSPSDTPFARSFEIFDLIFGRFFGCCICSEYTEEEHWASRCQWFIIVTSLTRKFHIFGMPTFTLKNSFLCQKDFNCVKKWDYKFGGKY